LIENIVLVNIKTNASFPVVKFKQLCMVTESNSEIVCALQKREFRDVDINVPRARD
jgi:hypothetical protein